MIYMGDIGLNYPEKLHHDRGRKPANRKVIQLETAKLLPM